MRRAFPLVMLALQGCAFGPRVRAATPLQAGEPSGAQAAQASEQPTQVPAEPGSNDAQGATAAHPVATAGDPADAPEHDASDHDASEQDEGEDEGDAHDQPAHASAQAPKMTLTDEEIADKARHDPASLGPMSIGRPNAGALFNGVPMPRGAHWELIDPGHAWGTRETVDFLAHSIDRVNERFPETAPLHIGHISARNGGWLSPHKSHQAGRDVDVGYYYRGSRPRWFARATAENLDVPRTWAFLKALVTETDVEMIFIDTPIQKLLSDHAQAAGEDPVWLDSVFQVRSKHPNPLVRWARGHDTHIHVRFFSPMAQELGRRAQNYLKLTPSGPPPRAAHAHAAPASSGGVASAPAGPTTVVMHKARSGDVLVNLAKQYGTKPEAIQQANGLRTHALKIGQTYKIPVPAKPGARAPAPTAHAPHQGKAAGHAPAHGHAARAPQGPPIKPSLPAHVGPVVIPPRRLPPARAAAAHPSAKGG
jgi:murein endopeptidase/LysM repeat protein